MKTHTWVLGYRRPKRAWIRKFRRGFPVLFWLFFCVAAARASDEPFDNPANWGGTGLMEIPTARVLDDGEIRFSVTQALPFRWFCGGMGIYPGLEFSGRLTAITNIASGLGEEYGANKDKSFDLKYQVLPESKMFPALAVGVHDFHGTRQFSAQYLVLSRQYYPVDFSFGMGRKRLGGGIHPFYSDQLGLFGGVEWAINEHLHVMAEYNPIEYENDPKSVRGVPEGADSPLNFGLRYKLLSGVALGLSYQRGNTLALQLNLQAPLGQPLAPPRADPPRQVPVDQRPFDQRNQQEMVEQIYGAVREAGFQEVSVYSDGQRVTAEFYNNRYLSNQKAVGRVLRILLFYSPKDATQLRAVLKERDVPILEIAVKPEHLEKYLLGEMAETVFAKLIEVKTAGPSKSATPDASASVEDRSLQFAYGIKPDMETYLNDPSGFFKFRVGIKPFMNMNVWQGAQFQAMYDVPFYSNIRSSNQPPPGAIKTDKWQYQDRNYSFEQLMLDQIVSMGDRRFGRVSAGYFDKMYAGVGAEVLQFMGDGHWAVGLEGDRVRKREKHSQFGLTDFEAYTMLGNLYYYLPEQKLFFNLKYGRFLAGDVGWRLDISREYDTGAILGFWYGMTDTDQLAPINRGYQDKGVYLKLPMRVFLTRDSPVRYNYAISPWTRDVGAFVNHEKNLFEWGVNLMPRPFRSDLEKIKE